MGVAVFNYDAWAARFPTVAAVVAEPLADMYFAEATDFLDNTDCSIVEDVAQRLRFLNLITAHIACVNGATPQGAVVVGRVSSVTEGSVTIASELKGFDGDYAAYFSQTSFGLQYWAMTAGFRTMRYVPGAQPFLGVPLGGGGLRWPY